MEPVDGGREGRGMMGSSYSSRSGVPVMHGSLALLSCQLNTIPLLCRGVCRVPMAPLLGCSRAGVYFDASPDPYHRVQFSLLGFWIRGIGLMSRRTAWVQEFLSHKHIWLHGSSLDTSASTKKKKKMSDLNKDEHRNCTGNRVTRRGVLFRQESWPSLLPNVCDNVYYIVDVE